MQLIIGELVGGKPYTVATFVDSLRVVVLIPEQRQHDRRHPERECLADGVVAAVRDHRVALGHDRGLWHELLTPHPLAERELVMKRTHRDDHPVRCPVQRVDHPLHQGHIHAAEAAQRQVNQLAVAADLLGDVEAAVGIAGSGVDAVPRRTERPRPLVVELSRIHVQVQIRRLVLKFAVRQRRCAALLMESRRPLDEGICQPAILHREVVPAAAVA